MQCHFHDITSSSHQLLTDSRSLVKPIKFVVNFGVKYA